MTGKQEDLIPKEPGFRLREERERQGLSISQVSERLHIRERIIEAIESDRAENIAPVYLRGYIKRYAAELGLDANELDSRVREYSGPDPELRSVFELPPRRGLGERWLKAGSYLVATILVAALVWQVTQQAVQFADGQPSLALGDKSSTAVSDESDSASGSQNASRGNHLAASIASLEKLGQGRNKSSSTAAEEAWKALRSGPGGELEAGPGAGDSVINLKVSADSWVEIIDATGATLELDLLRGGNARSYIGRAPFALMLGRASAVELEFNGEVVDLGPHIDGDVARLTLGAAETPSN